MNITHKYYPCCDQWIHVASKHEPGSETCKEYLTDWMKENKVDGEEKKEWLG